MVKFSDRVLVVVTALVLSLLSCSPYDVDRILCEGHGQCPSGYHCDLTSEQSFGGTAVCVPGEAGSAGIGASVQMVRIPAFGVTIGFMGSLHTARSTFKGVQEAINEDVLGFPLLLEATTQDDGSLGPRVRPAGQSLYSPEENQYVPQEERPSVYFTAPSLAARSPADVGVGIEPVSTIDLAQRNCGRAHELVVDNSVQTFAAGSSWQVGSLFEEPSIVDGPRMPTLPNPEGKHLVAGRILLVPGENLILEASNRSLDPLSQDIVLALGSAWTKFNRPDCGENICDDQIDNDGDGKVDCLDEDCEGVLGLEGDIPRICRESTCWDGIDNDKNGFADCEDQESHCSDSGCAGLATGNIVAFPVSDDGFVEVNWDELSSGLTIEQIMSNGELPSLMLAWGRTRSRIALDTERGVESALLSSTQWLIVETIILAEGQYVVGVEPQRRKELPGRVFNMQLAPVNDQVQWFDEQGYQVVAVDRYGQFAIGHQEGAEGPWLTPAGQVFNDVEIDVSGLCRGPAAVLVANCNLIEPGGAECSYSGVGTLDNRHSSLHCDSVFPSEAFETTVRPGQVSCSSFGEDSINSHIIHRYYFEAVAGTRYQIDALAAQLTMDSNLDVEMALFNGNGQQEEPLEGWGGQDYCSIDPRIVWQCVQTGLYEIRVEQFPLQTEGQDSSGRYKLLIEPL